MFTVMNATGLTVIVLQGWHGGLCMNVAPVLVRSSARSHTAVVHNASSALKVLKKGTPDLLVWEIPCLTRGEVHMLADPEGRRRKPMLLFFGN